MAFKVYVKKPFPGQAYVSGNTQDMTQKGFRVSQDARRFQKQHCQLVLKPLAGTEHLQSVPEVARNGLRGPGQAVPALSTHQARGGL